MQIKFEKLTKKKAKLYINLFGKSGCGKTYTALTIATALSTANNKVLIIDTEDRAHYYANDFDGVNIPLIAAKNIKVSELLIIIMQAQKELNIETVVIDSLTPFWDAMIEFADAQKTNTTVGAKHGANWKIPKKTINTMTLALRRCGLNVITTSLGKDETDKDMKLTGKILPCFERPKFEPYLDIQIILDKNGKILETPKKLHHDLNDIFKKDTQINKEWCEEIKVWLGNGTDVVAPNNILADAILSAEFIESGEYEKEYSKLQTINATEIEPIEIDIIPDNANEIMEAKQKEFEEKRRKEMAVIKQTELKI